MSLTGTGAEYGAAAGGGGAAAAGTGTGAAATGAGAAGAAGSTGLMGSLGAYASQLANSLFGTSAAPAEAPMSLPGGAVQSSAAIPGAAPGGAGLLQTGAVGGNTPGLLSQVGHAVAPHLTLGNAATTASVYKQLRDELKQPPVAGMSRPMGAPAGQIQAPSFGPQRRQQQQG